MDITTWLTVGLIAGVLASTFMRAGGLGLRGDIVLGVAGAIAGGWTFQALGWQPSLGGLIAVALVSAVIVLAGQRLLRRRDGPRVLAAGGFHRFATRVAGRAGNSSTFGLAALVIVGWAATGPLFRFSDTWQLVINTSTTIVTFLMVFLIQNTQNRDSVATQMKLDEIIRATVGAHNVLLDLEERSDDDLIVLRKHYADLAHRARADVRSGLQDTGVGSDPVA